MDYDNFLNQFNQLMEQTTRYIPPNARKDYMDNYDKYVDFPYVEDPKGFQTHRPMESDEPLGYQDQEKKKKDVDEQSGSSHPAGTAPSMKRTFASEQEMEPPPEEEAPPAPEGGEMPPEGGEMPEGGLPADMAGGDMGAGMPGQEEEKLSSSEIGRVYELKKIYARLSSVETYLSRATDQSILELRKFVAQSINLFEVVISNYRQFKEKVDDIIVQFYEFLDVVYTSLRKYYKDMQDVKIVRS